MARKRLSPTPILPNAGEAPAERAEDATPRTRRAPIADVAQNSATSSALEEMAETLRRARDEGRMVLSLPLEVVDPGYLVRDRLVIDEDDMAALTASLRARGQQTPVEVAALEGDRYGLISGWRRLTALSRLHAETGDPRFGQVLALLRKPEQSAEAYLAMVEENEIRSGLSYYERARIVAQAVGQGVFPDDRSALQGLFGSASRPRRSKIGSFLSVVRELEGALRFPEAIGERLGLRMAKALDEEGQGASLRADLTADPAPDAETEAARIEHALSKAKTSTPPAPKSAKPRRTRPEKFEPAPGIVLSAYDDGSLTLTGPGIDTALRERLVEWLKGQG